MPLEILVCMVSVVEYYSISQMNPHFLMCSMVRAGFQAKAGLPKEISYRQRGPLTSSFSIFRVASLDCSWWYLMSNSVWTGC